VYPDALVIQMHREPRTIVASSSSLSAQATAGQSERFVGDVIGRTQLELWSRGARMFRQAREKYDAAQFLDVEYRDFTADPIGTVDRVYEAFGLDLPGAVRDRISSVHEESRSGDRRPSHTYSLADFGLTEAEVDGAFAD